jgi:hypothetical protein
MERTDQELVHEQVADNAKQVAAVAAATGNIVKNAFMATLTESKKVGDKAVVFGALAGSVAFFQPWADLLWSSRDQGAAIRLKDSFRRHCAYVS